MTGLEALPYPDVRWETTGLEALPILLTTVFPSGLLTSPKLLWLAKLLGKDPITE
jgi:hypothetical protein